MDKGKQYGIVFEKSIGDGKRFLCVELNGNASNPVDRQNLPLYNKAGLKMRSEE